MKKIEPYKRIILIVSLILLISIAYKASAYFVANKPGINLSIRIDELMVFSPFWVIFYIAYYPAILLPFLVKKHRVQLLQMLKAYILVLCFTIPVYLFFVVRIQRPDFAIEGFFTRLVSFIYSSDTPVNLFPSQHVAFTWLAAFFMINESKIFAIGYPLLAVLVSLSVVYIKQHYFVDIPSGLLVAYLSYKLSYKSI